MVLGPAVLGGHGPRTGCPGGQLVLGPRVRGDSLRGGHPTLGHLSKMNNRI